ncbi:MAG: DUF4126 family protein [Anaerolineae bacterium]|nr:DUF4126 family protein [Anaerolineae bacterium]
MKLVIAAISAGGVLGVADQYMCLLIVSILSKTGLITLSPEMDKVFGSWWFIGIVAFFWLLTTIPAYASALDPTIIKWVNNITNAVSGFLVPVSAALLALASAGVITHMHPDLQTSLDAMLLFDTDGNGVIGGPALWVIGGSALTASALTGAKFLAKQAIGVGTGTAGTPVTGPVFATIENLASIVLMVLLYILSSISPWLLVGLLALVLLLVLGMLGYALYKLWKLAKGVGRVIRLIETRPRVGLSILAEFFIWGLGSMFWKKWSRGIFRIVLWVLWLLAIFLIIPSLIALFGTVVVLMPILEILVFSLFIGAEVLAVIAGIYIGLCSAASLMKMLDDEPEPTLSGAPVPVS